MQGKSSKPFSRMMPSPTIYGKGFLACVDTSRQQPRDEDVWGRLKRRRGLALRQVPVFVEYRGVSVDLTVLEFESDGA